MPSRRTTTMCSPVDRLSVDFVTLCMIRSTSRWSTSTTSVSTTSRSRTQTPSLRGLHSRPRSNAATKQYWTTGAWKREIRWDHSSKAKTSSTGMPTSLNLTQRTLRDQSTWRTSSQRSWTWPMMRRYPLSRRRTNWRTKWGRNTPSTRRTRRPPTTESSSSTFSSSSMNIRGSTRRTMCPRLTRQSVNTSLTQRIRSSSTRTRSELP